MPNSTIDIISKLDSNLMTDVDRYRIKYETREYDKPTATNVVIKFVSPALYTYEKFRFYLLKNSELKPLPPKNFYRPDYVSYDEYGTTTLWTLLLYINDIPSIEEFDKNEIFVPSLEAIYRLIDEIVRTAPIPISATTPYLSDGIGNPFSTPAVYSSSIPVAPIYSKKNQPDFIDPSLVQPTATVATQFYYYRETFVVDLCISNRQFVDITNEAVAQSIVFKIKGKTSFLYDSDYILKKNPSGKMVRVSWNKRDVSGDGLNDVIEEGMVIEIQYAKELTVNV